MKDLFTRQQLIEMIAYRAAKAIKQYILDNNIKAITDIEKVRFKNIILEVIDNLNDYQRSLVEKYKWDRLKKDIQEQIKEDIKRV